MSERAAQTRTNHTRWDPVFHFFLVPVTFLLFIWTVIRLVQHQDTTSGILLAIVFLLFVTILTLRPYALKVQDRVIRLEERLRLAELLPGPDRSRIPEFTEGQLIALRFASDAELPALAARTLAEGLGPKAIKDAIREWRGDYWRV